MNHGPSVLLSLVHHTHLFVEGDNSCNIEWLLNFGKRRNGLLGLVLAMLEGEVLLEDVKRNQRKALRSLLHHAW